MDVWDDAPTNNGALDDSFELRVPVDGELQVAASHVPICGCLEQINFARSWPPYALVLRLYTFADYILEDAIGDNCIFSNQDRVCPSESDTHSACTIQL